MIASLKSRPAAAMTRSGKRGDAAAAGIEAARDLVLTSGWLSLQPRPFQDSVVGHCRFRSTEKGAPAIQAGDPPGSMFAVVSGSFAVELIARARSPDILRVARPVAWFGTGVAAARQAHAIGLRALQPSAVLFLPPAGIEDIASHDPTALWRFGAVLAENLTAMNVMCHDLRHRRHVARIVAVLLSSGGCRLSTPPDTASIDIFLGHEDLAVMANVARTTAGAILHDLEKAGHVERRYRRIRLLNPDGMRSILAD